MGQEDTSDLAAPQAGKVAPEAVALRAQPRPVTRLNRRTLALLTGGLSAADLPPVKVTGGLISGASVEQDGQSIQVFQGIPFAAPPVGDLRWRPPQPVMAWEGVRKCVEYAPACPQPADGIYSFAYRQQSEDCLCLNVWTPTLRLPTSEFQTKKPGAKFSPPISTQAFGSMPKTNISCSPA